MREVRCVGDERHFMFGQKLLGEDGSETGRCHGEAAMSVRGDVFARFHAVAAKRRSITRNSQFGLLGPVLRDATTPV
jgi:hypothetical protein